MSLPPPDPPPDSLPEETPVPGPLARGVGVIAATCATLAEEPGVYRMLNPAGDVLYVGKAKSLKKRVVAYTHPERLPTRLQRMIAETERMEIVTTRSEVEALLLENTLIKTLKPRYNILLRDDKTFPHILLTGDHPWPRLMKHRGAKTVSGDYYGPFASAGAVNQTLTMLQRAFLLRTCTDAVFANRTRPCLLHQIKRCCAPCVERISREDYQTLLHQAKAFLSGHSQELQQEFSAKMATAAEALDYEQAAVYRDRIRAIALVQARQDISLDDDSDADVVALHQQGGASCVQIFFFRRGCNYGTRSYFPSHSGDNTPEQVMAAFLGQFYQDKDPPPSVLVNILPAEDHLLGQALSQQAGHKVTLACPQRGKRRRLVEQATENARAALERKQAESTAQSALLSKLADLFGLDKPPERIEVYDNSHIQGSHAVGAMVVAGAEGLRKSAYRTFNIRSTTLTPGDDFGMMREVLTRRFQRAQKEDPDRSHDQWPDLVLIDGGAGQLTAAQAVLEELGIDDVTLVGIAKGPDRNAGRERFFRIGHDPFSLPINDPVLFFLQRLRDEAHRFAIGTHRARRTKAMTASPLDEIPGIGAARKRALLHHFGSARAVAAAGLEDLTAVNGLSAAMAKKIHDHFHSSR